FYQLKGEPAGSSDSAKATSGDKENEPIVRAYSISFVPRKCRFFSAHIGDGFYVATKKFIIDDLIAANREQVASRKAGGDRIAKHVDQANRWQPVAHAMVRIRPEHWQHVIPEYQLGWAENNRRAVLNHLAMLSSVARAA